MELGSFSSTVSPVSEQTAPGHSSAAAARGSDTDGSGDAVGKQRPIDIDVVCSHVASVRHDLDGFAWTWETYKKTHKETWGTERNRITLGQGAYGWVELHRDVRPDMSDGLLSSKTNQRSHRTWRQS